MADKEGYQLMKSLGLCVGCNKRKAAPGKVYCELCEARLLENYHRRRMVISEEKKRLIREKDNKRKAQVYAERKKKGLCVSCGKRQTKNGVQCIECVIRCKRNRNKRLERQRCQNGTEWKNEIARCEYPQYGICYICCKNSVMKDKKVCEDCYEKICVGCRKGRESQRKDREARRMAIAGRRML